MTTLRTKHILFVLLICISILLALTGSSLLSVDAEPIHAPDTPVQANLSVDTDPLLGQESTFSCMFSSALDAPNTNAMIELPESASVVSGELNWNGDLTANSEEFVTVTVIFTEAGDVTVSCRVLSEVAEGVTWGDLANLYYSIGSNNTTTGFSSLSANQRAQLGTMAVAGEGELVENADTDMSATTFSDPSLAVPPSTEPSQTAEPETNRTTATGQLTVEGRWQFYNRDDNLDSEQMLVEIVRGDNNNHLAWCFTDIDGYYSCGPFDNPGSAGIKSYFHSYVGFTPNSDKLVTVNPDWGTDPSTSNTFITTTSTYTFSDGTRNVGEWNVTNGATYERAYWIVDDLIRVWKYVYYGTGSSQSPVETSGSSTVEWKIDSTHGTHYHRGGNIHLDGTDPLSDTVVGHEYGHNMMYTIYGNWMPRTYCPSPHYLQRSSHVNCAWTEGWANFITIAANNDPVYRWDSGASLNLETPSWNSSGWDDGDDVEGRVAGALWDVIDTADDGTDSYSDGGITNIWDTIYHQNDNNFSEYWSAWLSRNHNSSDAILDALYQNTIDYRSTVKPNTPTLISPSDGATVTDPTPNFTWSHDDKTTWYQIWLNGPNGNVFGQWYQIGRDAISCGSSSCTITSPETLAEDGSYRWWVRGWNSAGTGTWSSSSDFTGDFPSVTPDMPTLTSPSDGATVTDTTPDFSWSHDGKSTWYQIYLSGPSGRVFSQWYKIGRDAISCGSSSCTVTSPETLAEDGSYRWWVRGWNTYGTGTWSSGNDFTGDFPSVTPDIPTLTSPSDGATVTDTTPDFSWSHDGKSTWYQVYLSGPNGRVFSQWYMIGRDAISCGSSSCTVTSPETLAEDGSYRWWVRGWNSFGTGTWSSGSDFTGDFPSVTPDIPTLTSPSDGASITDPTPDFTWTHDGKSTWYQLYLSGASGTIAQWYEIGAGSLSCNSNSCTLSSPTSLSEGSHTWWVRGWNSFGTGTWSSGSDFSYVQDASSGFNSQFNGSATNWYSHSGSSMWWVNSNYLTSLGTADYSVSASYRYNYNNFDYQARVWRNGCDGCANALLVRGDPSSIGSGGHWDDYYAFQYTRYGTYSVWRRVNGSSYSLQGWTSSSAINTGSAWNTLRVYANGSNLYFYINGSLVWSGSDSSLSSGRAGLRFYRDASSSGNQFWADWATLSVLSSSSSAPEVTEISAEQAAFNAEPCAEEGTPDRVPDACVTGGAATSELANSVPADYVDAAEDDRSYLPE